MSDRPRNGAPAGDGSDRDPRDRPQFDWLYDGDGDGQADGGRTAGGPGATRPVPRERRDARRAGGTPPPRADETRMIRTQPRSQPAAPVPPRTEPRPPSRVRPTPPPVAPPVDPPGTGPGRGRGGRGGRGPRRRIRVLPVVLVLLLAWIAYLVVVPFLAWNKVDKAAWEPDGDRPAEQGGTTYLLVGSDSRADLTKEERQELSTGNPEGQRTDTIMLLHTGAGPNLLMSIPRDSLVEIPGSGEGKINGAFARGGAPLLVETIEQNTGIRVDDYAQIGLGGVVEMVDAVGGIEICPNHRMRDKLAGLDIKKGCQEVDGETALAYSRSRHTNLKLGDVARARQQREVVKAVGKKALSPWTAVNPMRYWNLNMAVPASFSFGEGTGKISAAKFGLALSRVNGDNGLTCGVPIRDLAVHWDEERSQALFAKIISDDTQSVEKDLCNPSGLPQ